MERKNSFGNKNFDGRSFGGRKSDRRGSGAGVGTGSRAGDGARTGSGTGPKRDKPSSTRGRTVGGRTTESASVSRGRPAYGMGSRVGESRTGYGRMGEGRTGSRRTDEGRTGSGRIDGSGRPTSFRTGGRPSGYRDRFEGAGRSGEGGVGGDRRTSSRNLGDRANEGRPARDRISEGRSVSDRVAKSRSAGYRTSDSKTAGERGRLRRTGAGRRGPNTSGKFRARDVNRTLRRDDELVNAQRITSSVENEFEDSGILEGRNPVMEAFKAGRSINRLIVSSGEREGSISKIISMAREKGVVVQEVEKSRLDFLSITGAHQGVIAYVSPKDYVETSVILDKAKEKGEEPFIIILDGVTDPHNLGSTIRTADAVGAHGIIIPKRRAVALNATVAKASAGALEYVDVARVTNISQTIEELKNNNVWVVGTDSSAEMTYEQADYTGPVAIVIGGEGEGIGKLVRENCDYMVNIPMKGGVSSLNASVAAAIMMYEVQRQRRHKE